MQDDEDDSDGGGQGSADPSGDGSAGGGAAQPVATDAPHLSPHAAPNAATCFRDGRRKIDFVLVYEEPTGNGGGATLCSQLDGSGADASVGASGGLLRSENTRSAKHEVRRQRFLDNLRRVGLEMEEVSREMASCCHPDPCPQVLKPILAVIQEPS